MDIKTKTLFFLVVIGVCVSIYLSYERTMVKRDFEIFDSEAEQEGF